jgi:enoyl-CoA hydratase
MTEVVRLAIADEVATITLARPEKLNALDGAMIAGLQSAADRIESDRSVRVAILTGEGKAFCAGGDIAAWGGLSPLDMGQDWVRNGHRVFDRLARLKVPMIAALNGHALGGGLELAATADIRICEAQAKLGLPETGIGMIPGWSGTQRLVTRFGARAVRRLALAGEIVTAEVALAMGLVDEVVEKGAAMDRAMALAGQVRSRGPVANTIAKQLINAAEGEDAAATMEILAGALVSYTDDLREGVAGFREKRPPVFQGR